MTSLEIENYANEESLSVGAGDVNLAVRLRKKVIPKFEADVGQAAWRRKVANLPIVSGTRFYDLPIDFADMLDWPLYDQVTSQRMLFYIGENAPMMANAAAVTTPGTPNGYWIDRITATPPAASELRRLQLDVIPGATATLRYAYLWTLRFTDMVTVIDFDNYIPPHLQWALVEALKAELYMVRAGIDDPRIAMARSEYDRYVGQAITYAEPGRKEVLKRVRQGPA